jgi:SSS family transporter
MTTASFVAFLLIFLAIGLSSLLKSQGTAEDYLVAGKSVPAWLTGLSAVATNNSGYMFIGMIGLTYEIGLSSIWLMIGWIIGDLSASLLTLDKLHKASRAKTIHSFGGLLSQWHGTDHRHLRRLTGLLTIIFLTLYAAAQLKAGSKATAVLLEWEPSAGVWIGAVIVLLYSTAGGLRASIWTDAAQSMVMLVGMALLIFGGLEIAGGWQAAWTMLSQIEPHYLDWFPNDSKFKITLFIAGWLFGGIAIMGQPHIVIRFISMDRQDTIKRMRLYYYSWFTLFYGATIMVGLLSRIAFPESAQFDAELALPTMAQTILPDILVGLVLAALFAATLSTADSLILSCSAAITRDFIQHEGKTHSLIAAKLATLVILATAAVIALTGTQSVFALVLDAWGLLGSAFVPLIIIHALGYRCPESLGIITILTGITTFLIWQQLGLGGMLYSVGPGILAGLTVFMLGQRFIPAPSSQPNALGDKLD